MSSVHIYSYIYIFLYLLIYIYIYIYICMCLLLIFVHCQKWRKYWYKGSALLLSLNSDRLQFGSINGSLSKYNMRSYATLKRCWSYYQVARPCHKSNFDKFRETQNEISKVFDYGLYCILVMSVGCMLQFWMYVICILAWNKLFGAQFVYVKQYQW